MSDTTRERNGAGAGEGAGATATAAPPRPPSAPPRTATAAPVPSPKRGRGCLIAGVLAVVVVLFALGGFVWWSVLRPGAGASGGSAVGSAADASAFASAMRKAGVKAPPDPKSPVDLVSLKTTGSHPFQATFTPDELAALVRAFSYTPTTGMRVHLDVQSISQTGSNLRLTGDVTASGTSYSGWIEGPVSFSNGKIVPTGAFIANTSGLSIGGGQAAQAAGALIGYLNQYIAAAPGLTVGSATVTADGVHVTGTAPESISW